MDLRVGVEIAGIPAIIAMGIPLHFVFDWTGHWLPVALFAPVNESVWEHFKLVFWPAVIWAGVGSISCSPGRATFWAAKGYALLIGPILIAGLFYGYTSVLGTNLLVLDIAIFVVAVVAVQSASIGLLAKSNWSSAKRLLGLGLLAGQLSAYGTFAFYPPPLGLFEDGRTGTRGMPPHAPQGPNSEPTSHSFGRPGISPHSGAASAMQICNICELIPVRLGTPSFVTR